MSPVRRRCGTEPCSRRGSGSHCLFQTPPFLRLRPEPRRRLASAAPSDARTQSAWRGSAPRAGEDAAARRARCRQDGAGGGEWPPLLTVHLTPISAARRAGLRTPWRATVEPGSVRNSLPLVENVHLTPKSETVYCRKQAARERGNELRRSELGTGVPSSIGVRVSEE
jgi:hypothetical protein